MKDNFKSASSTILNTEMSKNEQLKNQDLNFSVRNGSLFIEPKIESFEGGWFIELDSPSGNHIVWEYNDSASPQIFRECETVYEALKAAEEIK